VCQAGTGSLWRSRSNNSCLPIICEYPGFRILYHVLIVVSERYGESLCLATMPSMSRSRTRL
jgi:hypothetical protein